MTTYQSPIVLGAKYRDERTQLEGYANVVAFNENGCVEVMLEYMEEDGSKKDVKNVFFNELRLTPLDSEAKGNVVDYESDVKLGGHYRDTQTGLEGWASVIDFHEHMATRVQMRSVGRAEDGTKKLVYHNIDDFLLADLDNNEQVAERKTKKRSPATREVPARR